MLRSPVIISVCIISVMSSCVQYQYSTLTSATKPNAATEFVFENDSVKIRYRFYGVGGPVNIKIFNKLSIPVYVDWSRSSLVLNDRAQPYRKQTIQIEGEFSTFYSDDGGAFMGRAVESESISFIPSAAYGEWTPAYLQKDFIDTPKDKRSYGFSMPTKNGNMPAYQFSYDKEDSPLRIRSLITLSTTPDLSAGFVVEQEFWVSTIIETISGPRSLSNEEEVYDTFHNSKTTEAGIAIVITSAIILFVLLFSTQGHL